MALKELPALSGGRSQVVGTYFAEQVSDASFDLLSASNPGPRPGTVDGSRGRGAGSAPGTANGRRRHVTEQVANKCTMLPALQDSYTGLLVQEAEGDGSRGKQEESECRQQLREARKAADVERVRRASARLCRGERSKVGRTAVCATPSDEEVIRTLTAPLTCFAEKVSGSKTGRSPGFPGSSPASTARGKFRGKRHETYREAFSAGLAGTDLEVMPLRLKTAALAPMRGAREVRKGKDFLLSTTVELEVLPEDPVATFFKKEEVEKKAAAAADCAAQATGIGAFRRAHLREMLQHAVYKEDGALAQAARGIRHSVAGATVAAPGPAPLAALSRAESDDPPGEQPTPQLTPKPVEVSDAGAAIVSTAVGLFGKKGNDYWNDIIDCVGPKQKMPSLRREACLLLRMLVFATPGMERKKNAEKERIVQETCGTKEQVKLLYHFWDRLDQDCSGYIEMQEFKSSLDRTVSDVRSERRSSVPGRKDDTFQLPSLAGGTPEENVRLAQKTCERVSAVLAMKKLFVIEDLMRIIWPASTIEHLKLMRAWCDDFSLGNMKWRVGTPQVLSEEDYFALQAVFKFYDKDGTGKVSAEELIHAGLLDKGARYLMDPDVCSDGMLNIHDFCEIMCPSGYRAKADTDRATTLEGQRIVLDKRLGGWRIEDEGGARARTHA